ncbi:MAG: DUF4365 domain-containing protein [Magnetococcales bacterium]|nr:DUF4365 domain-containing protein [Magnetococcales bacterium]
MMNGGLIAVYCKGNWNKPPVTHDLADWFETTEDQLLLRHCGYWVSLRGEPTMDNTTNKTVTIPRNQLLTVDNLRSLMNRIGTGGTP